MVKTTPTKKKILVTGGTGFLGSQTILELKKTKFDITSLSLNKPLLKQKIKKVKYIYCDISNKKNLKKLNKNFDYIINFAGYVEHQNQHTISKHFKGCKNLVDHFGKNLRLFIQIGSSLEYSGNYFPNFEKDICRPRSNYGKSKLKATNFLKKKKINYVVLRLYQIYGPFQKNNRLIPQVINNLLRNGNLKVTSGSQKRDYLYIDDFTRLIKKILKKKKINNGIYNVGTGKSIEIKKIINFIYKKINKGKIDFGVKKIRKDESKVLYPNITKIKKEFNWKPKVKINVGINKTILNYKKNNQF